MIVFLLNCPHLPRRGKREIERHVANQMLIMREPVQGRDTRNLD